MVEKDILKIISNISTPRIKTYEDLGFKENDEEVLFAYFSIQEISSHFFVPLQVLEIGLRNSIHNALKKHFSKKWPEQKWYDIVQLSDISKQTLISAKAATEKKCGADYSDDDLISNITFGFWVYMLDEQHRDPKNPHSFWNQISGTVFPGKGAKKIKEIFVILKQVNLIRNRLYHHEPVWKKKGPGEYSYKKAIDILKKDYYKIMKTLDMLAPEKKLYMDKLGFTSRFDDCCMKYITT
jgi:hypothetical protein